MGITDIVYSPLKEESNNTAGWSKETIDYVQNNRKSIYKSIRGIAKGFNRILQTADVEDIYGELICYLYNCDDYNIDKAITRSNSGSMVCLEGYIHTCIKYCVIRHTSEMSKYEGNLLRESFKDPEGKELSLFDTIPDGNTESNYSDIGYDIRELLRSLECFRYAFGPDIFLIWYIRLLTLSYKNDIFSKIMEILDINKRDMYEIEQKTSKSELMSSIARAITLIGPERTIKELENYVYGHKRIQKLIESYC